MAIIRLSGPHSVAIASKIFSRPKGRQLDESHRLALGRLTNLRGELIDQCLAVWMQQPHSYTGEDVVELHTHGGSILAQSALQACLEAGARLANPGEFTMRAFMHGKIDLAQAEAVQQLISSRHQKAAQLAANNLEGAFSRQVGTVRIELLNWLSLLEAEIDFGDEIDSIPADVGLERCRKNLAQIERLLEGAQGGRAFAEGVKTVLMGPPNAGKSTLLNLVLGNQRALVTPIAGTTRDTIEETVVLHGSVLQLVDTAGLRDNPTDLVEELGIERTRQQAEQASLIVLVLDANDPLPELLSPTSKAGILSEFLELCRSRQALIVSNKHDLLSSIPSKSGQALASLIGDLPIPILEVSLLLPEDQLRVLQAMSGAAKQVSGDIQEVFSLTRRQTEALSRCRQCLTEVQNTLHNGLSAEFVALDLRQAIFLLGEIQGINVTEEVLDRIFSTFCLGK